MRTSRDAFPNRSRAISDAPDPQTNAPRPSKSQVKREMLALLDLGKTLVALPDDKLKRLPLSEALYEAIRLAQRITSREGRRRQIHYVGKLMRQAPAQDIQAQLYLWKHGKPMPHTNPPALTTS